LCGFSLQQDSLICGSWVPRGWKCYRLLLKG
jgi:hypothetical protein